MPKSTHSPTLDESYRTDPVYDRVFTASNAASFPVPEMWLELGFSADKWKGFLVYLVQPENSYLGYSSGKTVSDVLSELERDYAYEVEVGGPNYVDGSLGVLTVAERYCATGGTRNPTAQPTTLAETSITLYPLSAGDHPVGVFFTLSDTSPTTPALVTTANVVPGGPTTIKMWNNKITFIPVSGAKPTTISFAGVPSGATFEFSVSSAEGLTIFAVNTPRSGVNQIIASFGFTGPITLGPDTATFHKQSGPAGRRLIAQAKAKEVKKAKPEGVKRDMRDRRVKAEQKAYKGGKASHGGKRKPPKHR